MRLVKYPDLFLVHQMRLFDFDVMDPLQISNQMFEIMRKHGGIGISANQVGINAQIFVQELQNNHDLTELTVINPRIISTSDGLESGIEGCLSHPDLQLNISRPQSVQVEFLDKYADVCIMDLTGLDARCFLHEYDHLQGIVFTDHVSRLRLNQAKRKRYGRTK